MNSIQIDQILNTIDTTSPSSSLSSYPQSPPQQDDISPSSTTNSSSSAAVATRIERIEMPTPMLFPHVAASSGARNGR